MHMKLDHGALVAAAKSIAGAVVRDSMSSWRHVRIDATENAATLTACDGDIQIERRIGAVVEASGVILVPGRQFVAFANALPVGLCEVVTSSPVRAKLMAGAATFAFEYKGVEDWPVFSGPGEKVAAAYLPAITFREMLRKASWAMSKDPTRQNLRCVHMKLSAGKLLMVATDGRALAQVEHGVESEDDAAVSLPEKLVGVLSSILGSEGDVRLAFDSRSIRVTAADWSVTSRAVDAVYPDWHRVIPANLPSSVTVARKEFVGEMERAALAAPESGAIDIAFAGKTVDFASQTETARYKSAIVPSRISGEPGEYTIDGRIIKSALGCLDADDVTIDYAPGGTSPIVLTSGIPWLAVIMPLRRS